ncbi:MAG: TIGR03086 family metal-binding protein, partial [Acidimicrobiia bacterium]
MDTLKLLSQTFESTGRIVAGVRPDQMDAPTPCGEWDVRALLDHAIGVIAGFAAAASRADSPGEPPAIGDNPQPAFDAAARATLDAWHRPGALEGMCTLAHGITLPAEVAAGINFVDTLVHGWDLARATGQDSTLDPELATAALEI